MQNLFELENVEFKYLQRFTALNKVSLTITRGESVVILGANGSGKSTLLHILAGLIYPQKGLFKAFGRFIDKTTFDDEDFRRYFRSRVALLFQNPEVQLFSPSVQEELYFGLLQLDLLSEQVERNIESLGKLLDIKKLFKRSPHQLSIGEKKKIAIASILVVNPEVLLLDEPTAGLDPRTCNELIDLILEYHAQQKTIVTATHDLHIVPEIADKVYILDEEKTIVSSGKCEDILSDEGLLVRHNLIHFHRHRHKDTWHKHPHQHIS